MEVENIVTSAEVKAFAYRVGFTVAGIVGRDRISLIPDGPIADVFTLRSPKDLLLSTRSVVVLGYRIWDPVYNIVVTRPDPKGNAPFHQLYAEVASNKAWEVAHYLKSEAYEAVSTKEICLKKAAVLAGIGAQGKHTVVVSPIHGSYLRFAAVLTSAELEDDRAFTDDLCVNCMRCIDACPAKALTPFTININRCMVYASENPNSGNVPAEVRELERRLIKRPSKHGFIECTICLDSCPIGRNAI